MGTRKLHRAWLLLCLGLAMLAVQCGGGSSVPSSSGSSSGSGSSVALSSLSPIVEMASSPTFTLTLNGSGFASGDSVVFNGTSVPATVVTSTQLTASIPTSAISSAGSFNVTVQASGTNSNAEKFYVVPAINPNAVSVSAGGTTSVNVQLSALSNPTLLLQAVGGSTSGTANSAASGEVSVSPGSTVNLFVVGGGVVPGTFYEVSGNNDITVTQPIASDFTQTTTGTPGVNFNINVSSSAAAGARDLVVTNPAGEITDFPGSILVQ